MMRFVLCAPTVALLLLGGSQTTIVRPVDQAPRDPTLAAFRVALLHAIEHTDTLAVLSMVDAHIGLGFGGDAGIDEFRRILPAAWRELHDILSHGGQFGSDSTFYAPYWCNVARLPIDAFEAWIVIDSAAPVRSSPDVHAPVLTSLAYAIIQKDRTTHGAPGWEGVILGDGRHGFVDARQLRSPIGMRVGLFRRAGRWWLGSYFGGD